MDFEKESFEDDNDLSRLEDDEELGGETQEMVETEEEELAIVGEESEEEAPAPRPAPAARPAPKKAAKKKTVPKKKAKAKAKKKAAKKPAEKTAKKKSGAKRSGHDRKCFRKSWGLVPALSFVGSCHFKLRAVPDSGSSQLEHELFHLRTPPLTQKGSSCLNRQVPLA